MFYAGFFAVWYGTKNAVDPIYVILSGGFMVFSLTIYSLWAVVSTHYMVSVQKLSSARLIDSTDLSRIIELENASKLGEKAAALFKWQPLVLYLSVGGAGLGILTILGAFLVVITPRLIQFFV